MKNLILGLSLVFVFAASVSCKKKKDDNNNKCGELELKVTTTPANGANESAQPGTDFPVHVNIEILPAGGATITVTAKADGTSTPYFTKTIDNALTSNDILITGTPKTVTCVVETVVTSKTCNTNQWKGTYRYAAK